MKQRKCAESFYIQFPVCCPISRKNETTFRLQTWDFKRQKEYLEIIELGNVIVMQSA